MSWVTDVNFVLLRNYIGCYWWNDLMNRKMRRSIPYFTSIYAHRLVESSSIRNYLPGLRFQLASNTSCEYCDFGPQWPSGQEHWLGTIRSRVRIPSRKKYLNKLGLTCWWCSEYVKQCALLITYKRKIYNSDFSNDLSLHEFIIGKWMFCFQF